MFKLIVISSTFFIGLFLSPIYAVVTGIFALLINLRSNLGFKGADIFILFYVVVVSICYIQLDDIPAIKEALIYVVGPFLFFFLGKALLKTDIDKRKLYLCISYIFAIYSFYLFFTDYHGNTSFDLSQNYYYNSRNNLLIKSELKVSFINETNLSLLVLTSLLLVNFVIRNRSVKFFLSVLLVSSLLILASRTSIVALVAICIVYFIKFQNLKSKFFTLFLGLLIFSILIFSVDVFQIPYISTFFNRTLDKSFGGSTTAYGLESRFIHYVNAYENSQVLFDIKGYKYLLNTYGFTSHNEVLGHSSSTGLLPTLWYFTVILIIVRNRLKMLNRIEDFLFFKVLFSLVICYFVVGLTENIYVSNIIWMYFFLFTAGITTTNEIDYVSKAN